MSRTVDRTPTGPGGDQEAAKALADLLRTAEIQGVKPFISLEDFAGEPDLTADFEVNEFLRQVRKDRDHYTEQSPE